LGWILNARAVPGNVSQGSVFWVPPIDITKSDPDQQFEIQLWDLESEMGCSSPVFKFAKINESDDPVTTTAVPYGPFVTTAISIIGTGYVTVTATVATYQSDTAQFDQAITGSITATDGAVTSGTVALTATSSPTSPTSPAENDSRPSNTVAIAVGTVGGVLAVALVILSTLLWRARRKQASEKARARADSTAEPKETSSLSTPESQLSPAAEVSGDTARHEMMGSSTALHELPSQNMEPVELAADEIGPPNSYPGHGDYSVSPTSRELKRSLSFDRGTFTVSPLSAKRDRKE
jgi:hypothetical protein